MVSFRLSEQDYQKLLNLCGSRGARSLSDLARDAVQDLLGASNGSEFQGSVESEVRKLNGRIEEIDRGLKRLTQLLEEPATANGKMK
jgi:hypothetical protein